MGPPLPNTASVLIVVWEGGRDAYEARSGSVNSLFLILLCVLLARRKRENMRDRQIGIEKYRDREMQME